MKISLRTCLQEGNHWKKVFIDLAKKQARIAFSHPFVGMVTTNEVMQGRGAPSRCLLLWGDSAQGLEPCSRLKSHLS